MLYVSINKFKLTNAFLFGFLMFNFISKSYGASFVTCPTQYQCLNSQTGAYYASVLTQIDAGGGAIVDYVPIGNRILLLAGGTNSIKNGNNTFSGGQNSGILGPSGRIASAIDGHWTYSVWQDTKNQIYRFDGGANNIYISPPNTLSSSTSITLPDATTANQQGNIKMTIDPNGNIYYFNTANKTIVKMSPTTNPNSLNVTFSATSYVTIGTSAAGLSSGQGGFVAPSAVASDSKGNIYVADKGTHQIKKWDSTTNSWSIFAGNGAAGFSGDGAAATSAQLSSPNGVVVDSVGNVIIADTNNKKLRVVWASTGQISSINYPNLVGPVAVKVDFMDSIYVNDRGNIIKLSTCCV